MPSAAEPVTIDLRVRYAETDQMGVVYHANYFVWCELGRTSYIRDLGRTYAELEAEGVLLAVADASARFHAGARYDERVRVATTLAAVRSRMVAFDYVITAPERGDARLVTAHTTLVSIDRAGRPAQLPAAFRDRLEQSRA